MSISGGGQVPEKFGGESITEAAQADQKADKAALTEARQATANESLQAYQDRGGAAAMKGKQRKEKKENVKSRVADAIKQKMQAQKGEMSEEQAGGKAEEFSKRNPELKKQTLMSIRQQVKQRGSDPEKILEIIVGGDGKKGYYSEDPSLADEALEFLEQTLPNKLREKVSQARAMLNEERGAEVARGRNIGATARALSKQIAKTPTALKGMYNKFVDEPKDAHSHFKELIGTFRNYQQLRGAIDFFYRSIGADLKAGGPHIDRGHLNNLMLEVQTLQAFDGAFKLFQSRENQMNAQLTKAGIEKRPDCNFESITKIFIGMLSERYPSTEALQNKIAGLLEVH